MAADIVTTLTVNTWADMITTAVNMGLILWRVTENMGLIS